MADVSKGEYPGKLSVSLLPITDLNPNDTRYNLRPAPMVKSF